MGFSLFKFFVQAKGMNQMVDATAIGNRAGRRSAAESVIEPLENRVLLAAVAPTVTSAIADNRAQVTITFSQKLDVNTVTVKNVKMYKAGPDKTFGTKDDVLLKRSLSYNEKTKTLVVTGKLKANKSYRLVLADAITNKKGIKLDGEFNGKGTSGNGKAGGRYQFRTKPMKNSVAMFQTVAGKIEVRLFSADTPITVENFLRYADGALWDDAIIHRSVPDFVIQGGGFNVTKNNQVDTIPTFDSIQNEPGISNTFGTIAMARIDDGNPDTTEDMHSATSQWFFNLSDDNTFLDASNGGFTVFGEVANGKSEKVMRTIAAYPVNRQFASPFSELPVVNEARKNSIDVDPKEDLVIIRRISIKRAIVAV